jgi:hypothetical protein
MAKINDIAHGVDSAPFFFLWQAWFDRMSPDFLPHIPLRLSGEIAGKVFESRQRLVSMHCLGHANSQGDHL